MAGFRHECPKCSAYITQLRMECASRRVALKEAQARIVELESQIADLIELLAPLGTAVDPLDKLRETPCPPSARS